MAAQAPQRRQSWHDVLEVQGDLAGWYRTRSGVEWLTQSWEIAAEGQDPELAVFLQQIYGNELGKVRGADPIFVSAEMCELVAHAAESFRPEPLMPSDLLTGNGFLMWEQPFEILDRWDDPIRLAGMSWAPIVGDTDRGRELAALGTGELLRWFQERDYGRMWQEAEEARARGEEPMGGFVDGLALTLYAENQRLGDRTRFAPRLLPNHLTPWWFGMTLDADEDDGQATALGVWWRLAQTTLRLMQQRIAHASPYRPDRAARRSAQRAGLPEDRDVVVVRLRREKNPRGDEPETEANYSHRFVVGGHWRNQWYPSESVHRQIWISPYLKGPDHLPLIWRPNRVYQWSK